MERDIDKLLEQAVEKANSKKDDNVDSILKEFLPEKSKKETNSAEKKAVKNEKPAADFKVWNNEPEDEQFNREQKKLIGEIEELIKTKNEKSSEKIKDEINNTIESSKLAPEIKDTIKQRTSSFKKFDSAEFNEIFGRPEENIYIDYGKNKRKKKKEKNSRKKETETDYYSDVLIASGTEEMPAVKDDDFISDTLSETTLEKAEAKSDKSENDSASGQINLFDSASEKELHKAPSDNGDSLLKMIKENKSEDSAAQKSVETGDSTAIRMDAIKNAVEEVKEKKGFFRNVMSTEEEDVDETMARELEYFQSRKEIDEFEGPEDKESVLKSLQYQVKEAVLKIIMCAVITIPLFFLTVLPAFNVRLPAFIDPSQAPFVYAASITFLTLILILCCISTVFHGLSSLFRLKPDQESLVAISLLMSLAHSIYLMVETDAFSEKVFLYNAVAGIILIMNLAGKYMEARVVLKNFTIVSSTRNKSAVFLYDEDIFYGNFPYKYKENGEKACIGANAKFVSDFLNRSYSIENIENKIKPIHYFSVLIPAAVCVAKYFISKQSVAALLMDLSFSYCMCAPFASTISYWLPVSKITNFIRRKGVALIGYGSIKKYKYIGAVTLSDKDLFRKRDVTISALKFYEPTGIDEYITKIASLLYKTNSTMSDVFMNIVDNNTNILLEVDDFSFDQGQGIIGYINGEKIVCGTRSFVASYGTKIPGDESVEASLPVSKKVSYVSIAGKLVASFETNYRVTKSSYDMFGEICRERLDILIYTLDYNLSEIMVKTLFSIEGSLVSVMDKTFFPVYEKLSQPVDRVKADIVSVTGNKGIAFAVCKIPKISNVMSVGVLVKGLTLIISLLICAAVVIANGVIAATPLHLLLFQTFWVIPYIIISFFSK